MEIETIENAHTWFDLSSFEADRIAIDTALGLPNAAAETSIFPLISYKEDEETIDFYFCGCHPAIDAHLPAPKTIQIRR